MLEVRVIECSPTEWEWRVCDPSGWPLMLGWKRKRNEAKHEAEKALFKLLASGSRFI